MSLSIAEKVNEMIFIVDPKIKNLLPPQQDAFDHIMALRGETYRELENRRTQKILLGNKHYFLKQHFGVGWKEIFKNILQLRLPVISAKNEWLAITRLHTLGIPTLNVVGYGRRGWDPAHMQSFLMTEELPEHISLEDFCKNWKTNPPDFLFKQKLLNEVARIAKTIHQNGINHRDFYICHFLLTKPYSDGKLYLIDLHRAQIRRETPVRWIIKDLAGLYFSSKDIGLTTRDLLRFMKEYRNKSLRDLINMEPAFWQKVKQRGDKLYQQHAN